MQNCGLGAYILEINLFQNYFQNTPVFKIHFGMPGNVLICTIFFSLKRARCVPVTFYFQDDRCHCKMKANAKLDFVEFFNGIGIWFVYQISHLFYYYVLDNGWVVPCYLCNFSSVQLPDIMVFAINWEQKKYNG